MSVLPWNETILISFVYTFVPYTILGRIVPFSALLEYSNTS